MDASAKYIKDLRLTFMLCQFWSFVLASLCLFLSYCVWRFFFLFKSAPDIIFSLQSSAIFKMLMCQMFLGCAHCPTLVSSTCVHLAICHFPQGWHTLSDPTPCLDVVVHACIPPATTQQAITTLTHNITVLPRDGSNMWPSSRSTELCGYC